MSVDKVTHKYFRILVAWFGRSSYPNQLALPCVGYSSEEKLRNYLKKAGFEVLECEEIK